MAANQGCSPDEIDVRVLRAILVEGGAII